MVQSKWDTSRTAASAAVAKSVGEARPPGNAKCSAPQHADDADVSREAVLAATRHDTLQQWHEIEGALMDFGNGFITEADLRFAVTKLGAEFTNEVGSDMVPAIREVGGGVYIGDEAMVITTMRSCQCVRSVSDWQTSHVSRKVCCP